jgi:hypothetical protein
MDENLHKTLALWPAFWYCIVLRGGTVVPKCGILS